MPPEDSCFADKLVLCLSSRFLACATPAAAAEITFESDVWDLGGTFDLSILVSDAPDLFTYGVDLLFDATVLSFVGASNGTLLPADSFGSVDFDNFIASLVIHLDDAPFQVSWGMVCLPC